VVVHQKIMQTWGHIGIVHKNYIAPAPQVEYLDF